MADVLLDEDEQEAIVEECRTESQRLERIARRLFALINGVGLVLVAWSFFFVEQHGSVAMPHDSESSHGIALAYSGTMIAFACALLITIGSAKRSVRLVGGVAACVPAAARGPSLLRLGAPLAAWWIAIAGPLSVLLSLYIDADMTILAKDVTSLSGLRYKYKKV